MRDLNGASGPFLLGRRETGACGRRRRSAKERSTINTTKMMKIWSMKQNAAAEEKKKPKVSAAQIRVQKDLTELSLPSTMKTHFPNPEDLLNFQLAIKPDEGESLGLSQSGRARWHDSMSADDSFLRVTLESELTGSGMYKNGTFDFTFAINNNYPHDPPKVKCVQKIYHPNIDLEGNVCLNILREDWKPVLNLNSVMVGLQFLFIEPNAADPLNKGMYLLFAKSTSTPRANKHRRRVGSLQGSRKVQEKRQGFNEWGPCGQ